MNPDSLSNPYKPPVVETKLAKADAADIRHRDIAIFVLLNVVTLGVYWFYLAYQWAKEVNGLLGTRKYDPGIVLLVSILSCGVAGLVFECLYAFDIAAAAKSRGVPDRREQLPTWVIVCNCLAMGLSLIPFAVVIAFPLGIMASVLVQLELNKLAQVVE
jgi:hypothetical protein